MSYPNSTKVVIEDCSWVAHSYIKIRNTGRDFLPLFSRILFYATFFLADGAILRYYTITILDTSLQ